MMGRFQLLFDGTIFDNLTLKRHTKASELHDILNELSDRLTDYEARYDRLRAELKDPGNALQQRQATTQLSP